MVKDRPGPSGDPPQSLVSQARSYNNTSLQSPLITVKSTFVSSKAFKSTGVLKKRKRSQTGSVCVSNTTVISQKQVRASRRPLYPQSAQLRAVQTLALY